MKKIAVKLSFEFLLDDNHIVQLVIHAKEMRKSKVIKVFLNPIIDTLFKPVGADLVGKYNI